VRAGCPTFIAVEEMRTALERGFFFFCGAGAGVLVRLSRRRERRVTQKRCSCHRHRDRATVQFVSVLLSSSPRASLDVDAPARAPVALGCGE